MYTGIQPYLAVPNAVPAHTNTSSVFSNEDGDYDAKLKEIEEHYMNTLVNENEQHGANSSNDDDENISDISSVNDSTFKQLEFIDNGNTSSSLWSNNNNADNGFSNSGNDYFEVQINSYYAPSIDLLPLTTANLQILSTLSSETAKLDETISNAQKTGTSDLNRQLFKTELCQTFATIGECKYSNKCQFAHGLQELKSKQRSTNFRTKPCNNWAKFGDCRYGKRCCFKHGDDSDIQEYQRYQPSQRANPYTGYFQDKVGGMATDQLGQKRNLHANVKALQTFSW